MKTLISLLTACGAGLVLAFAAPAGARTVGNGQVVTEARQVPEFDGVSTAGSIDLVVRQAATQAVELQGDSNLLPLVETVVEGRKLVVRWKRGESVSHRQPLVVRIDAVKLATLASAGSGDITVDGVKTPALKVSLSGSADARLKDLATEQLEIVVAGSSDVRAAGSARQLTVRIAGSGDVHLADLVADEVRIKIAGSGDASVRAEKSLEVSIAGSGDVTWTGAATQVKSSTAGSGTVTRR